MKLTTAQAELLDWLTARGPKTIPEASAALVWAQSKTYRVLRQMEAKGLSAHAACPIGGHALWWTL